ncbi:GDP-mannose 4,6-dehydratase [Agreia sp. VKM Ac-1783]|uniref:GDP-mannose 4,6-dehydratase n=1 Tax=Agreia sp. VKM Ac-1783 TaxID=1938889 RepID=UPI000A2ACD4C|nr:GDP-mannose 4,6-dehydratase [Agreia sp. VKM Ac-1783]SMQ58467.1 GDPmannose 4,6-dehydratase [Agreia sp. VKM Ac-1783]
MPTALITGISGQDGFYLSELLIASGYEVHGIVRSSTAADLPSVPMESVQLHELDVASPGDIDDVVRSVAPDEIFNLAALSSVYRSWQDPVLTAEVNAISVAQLLESAWRIQERTGKAVRFAQASSAEIFGRASESPQTELTPINPSSPYGAAKAYAHHIVGVYRQRGMFASSCIFYNHESPRRPESFVTRKITSSAARIASGLQDKLELGSLESRRDWGWAPDFANAIRLALTVDRPDDFIIATGESHSVADFVECAFARVGIDDWRSVVSINSEFSRPVDPAEQVGDASKARRVLGWAPTVSFRGIVEAMVDEDLRILRQQ